jgi:hypothetical protein
MGKTKSGEVGICVYCGQSDNQITVDHIPPKNLFPDPKPSNLITVPCCLRCNQKAAKDDEYFRTVITMREDIAKHPEAMRVLPAVQRGLRRPTGFRKAFGSCVTKVRFQVPHAQSLDHMGRDPFGLQHRFIGCHIERQIWLVDPPEGPQIGAERRTCPFAGMTVDFTAAITIVIASPCMHSVAHSRVGRMTATIALPCIGVEYRARNRDVCRDQRVTGGFGRVVADPETARARVRRDDADAGGTIVGEGPVPLPLVGPPPGRILGVRMGRAFFPPRSGTVRWPQRPCRASPRSARYRAGWLGGAAVGYAVVAVTRLIARQAGRRFALGQAAPQEHASGRSLPSGREDGPRQEGVIAITRATAIGRKVALLAE